jgi:CheY-like chemotaxis protein
MSSRTIRRRARDDPISPSRRARRAGLRHAAEFVESFPATRGCLVLDLNLPGQNGLDLQQTLAASPDPLPIVFLRVPRRYGIQFGR